MLDINNKQVRRVQTPIGEWMLDGIDFTIHPPLFHVRISKKDSKTEIQSPCIFKFFTAEELHEI